MGRNWKFSAGEEEADKGHQAKSNNAMVLPTLTMVVKHGFCRQGIGGRKSGGNADEGNETYRGSDKAG